MSIRSGIRRAAGIGLLIAALIMIPFGAAFTALWGTGIPMLVIGCAALLVGAGLLFGPKAAKGIKATWARRKEVRSLSDLDRIVEEEQNELLKGATVEKTAEKAETPKANVTLSTVKEKDETKQARSGPMFGAKKEGEKSARGTDDNLESDKGSEGPPK